MKGSERMEKRGRKKLPAELKRYIHVKFKFNKFERERFDSLTNECKIILNEKSNSTIILEALETLLKKIKK